MNPDIELVQACVRGEALAQKQLYERFAPRMLGVCYRYVQNIYEAEDVMQDGFIRVFRYLKDYRGEGMLEGWIRRIFVTTALNYLKGQKNFRSELEITAAVSEYYETDALGKLESQEVMNLIQQLPPGYRTVLNLFAIEGFSHKEIGEMLNISESTSRSQYTRARQMLIKKIDQLSIPGVHERTTVIK